MTGGGEECRAAGEGACKAVKGTGTPAPEVEGRGEGAAKGATLQEGREGQATSGQKGRARFRGAKEGE